MDPLADSKAILCALEQQGLGDLAQALQLKMRAAATGTEFVMAVSACLASMRTDPRVPASLVQKINEYIAGIDQLMDDLTFGRRPPFLPKRW